MRYYLEIMNAMAFGVSQASKKIAEYFYNTSLGMGVDDKEHKLGLPDYVTETDIKAQKIIESALHVAFPDIQFVGEEGGQGTELKKSYFLVDPIDGTSNFVALRDYFACCAAYVEDADVKAAVIADPIRGFLIKAYKRGGCFRTQLDSPFAGKKLLPLLDSGAEGMRHTQLECELSMTKPHHFSIIEALVPRVSGMRKSGSTALDIANMVQGRRLLLVSEGLEMHDLAAGLLIARESGCSVVNFDGTEASIYSKDILLGTPSHLGEVSRVIRNIKGLNLV